MRNFLITARDTIVPVSPISSLLIASSNLLFTPISFLPVTLPSSITQKIDCVRYITLSGGVITFT